MVFRDIIKPPLQASSGTKLKIRILPIFAYLAVIIYSGPTKGHSRPFKK